MFERRRALGFLASLPVSSILIPGVLGAASGAEPTRDRVLLVLNDIQPAVLPTGLPYRILSCKDLVQIRNAFVGLTSERILTTPEFNNLYLRILGRHKELLQQYQTARAAVEAGWNSADLERVKDKRVEYFLDAALATIALTAAFVVSAPAACFIVSTITLFSAAKSTWQLFRIEKGDNAFEYVVAFNDAKYGTLGLLSQRADPNASAVLKHFNKYTWGALSLLFSYYGVVRTEYGVRRLTYQKEIVETAKLNVETALVEINNFMGSKERFLEYVRVVSGNAALATEKIWTATSLNNCAIDGTIGISRLLTPSASGPILRSMLL